MQTITISATKARNNFFELLTSVSRGDKYIVEKDKNQIARIVPISDLEDWNKKKVRMLKVFTEANGILKGEKFTSQLRGKKARAWLGRWDKNIKW